MNNEDINNLEEIINLCKEEINNNDKNITAILDLEDLKSLENLLTRYKELEEKNKTQLEAFELGKESSRKRIEYDYIPKSKVKEKIEELDKRIDFLNTELTKCYIEREKLGTETDIDNNEAYIFYMEEEKNFREKQEEILQELLREE